METAKYTVKYAKRKRTLTVHHGWHVGLGFHKDERQCSYEAWCVFDGDKFFCECRSNSAAIKICTALNGFAP